MKTKKITRELMFLVMHLTPFIYLWMIYDTLPDIVPTHFNMQGEADGFSSRGTLIWIIAALNGFGYFLFVIIPFIDPKKFANTHEKIYFRIRIGMTFLLVGLSILMVYLTTGDALKGILALGIVFALLCIFLGNYLQAVKPNYFIGIRTPWTLNNEDNWRRTHLLTGRILFYGGLLSIPVLFLVPSNMAPIGGVSVLLFGTFFGLIYSYILFRNKKKEIV
jgi:uncharacterized membrane protein